MELTTTNIYGVLYYIYVDEIQLWHIELNHLRKNLVGSNGWLMTNFWWVEKEFELIHFYKINLIKSNIKLMKNWQKWFDVDSTTVGWMAITTRGVVDIGWSIVQLLTRFRSSNQELLYNLFQHLIPIL